MIATTPLDAVLPADGYAPRPPVCHACCCRWRLIDDEQITGGARARVALRCRALLSGRASTARWRVLLRAAKDVIVADAREYGVGGYEREHIARYCYMMRVMLRALARYFFFESTAMMMQDRAARRESAAILAAFSRAMNVLCRQRCYIRHISRHAATIDIFAVTPPLRLMPFRCAERALITPRVFFTLMPHLRHCRPMPVAAILPTC